MLSVSWPWDVKWLIDQGVKYIFYPCIPYERKDWGTNNHLTVPLLPLILKI